MPAATRSRRTLSATAALAGGLLTVGGCGSSPDAADAPHRNPPSQEAPAVAGDAAREVVPVPVLRMTADDHGAPPVYTLMLVEEAGTLPSAVTDALKPDFATESVVFLGMGRQDGEGFGTRITGLTREGDELTVAATFERPDGDAAGEPTTPWSAVVIPRQAGLAGPLLSDFR